MLMKRELNVLVSIQVRNASISYRTLCLGRTGAWQREL